MNAPAASPGAFAAVSSLASESEAEASVTSCVSLLSSIIDEEEQHEEAPTTDQNVSHDNYSAGKVIQSAGDDSLQHSVQGVSVWKAEVMKEQCSSSIQGRLEEKIDQVIVMTE